MQDSTKYKQIIYIVGTTATGKTTTAEMFRYLYIADVINIDQFYDFAGIVYGRYDYDKLTLMEEQEKYPDFMQWMKKWVLFKLGVVRKTGCKTLVIEGATLSRKEVRDVIEELVNAPSIMVLLDPTNWMLQYMKKHGMRPAEGIREVYKASVEGEYQVVSSLEELTQPLGYQRIGFTDKKWESLELTNLYGKSLLDLGCSAGWFNMYADEQGLSKYTGVDNYWRNIVRARNDHSGNYYLQDINEFLDSNKDSYDIVVMASTLHYFKNKEEIIKKIFNITKEVFVLEIPIHEGEELKEYKHKNGYKVPTQALVEKWMSEAGFRVELVGQSPPPDGSFRLVFKGYK